MANARLLPRYRGIRMRPYMRYMSQILFSILFVIGSLPIAYYAYMIKDKLQVMDSFSISLLVTCLFFVFALSGYLQWYLQQSTIFFAKWDRLKRFARFLYEHNYVYEKKSRNGKRKVSFPKVYLKQNQFDLEVAVELAGSKFQQKFKKIGGDLEDTFGMDFMESEDDDRFKTYRLAYSALLNRIKIQDMTFDYEHGLMLMKNFYWDFLSDPHLLIAGGTGGGKTVLLRFLILILSKIGLVDIADPKRADFVTMADIKAFSGRVSFEVDDIVSLFENAERIMYERYDFMRAEMKRLGHTDLRKFYEYGLEPYFLVCDEYNSFINSLNYSKRDIVERCLIKLTLLGRQAGVNVILAMQKPTSEDIPTKVRDNMNMRIAVGRLSDTGYNMMFGDENANKSFKFMKWVGGMRVYGRGYAAVNGELAREFYSPLLEKKFSFHAAFSEVERREHKHTVVMPTTDSSSSAVVAEEDTDIEEVQEKQDLKTFSVEKEYDIKALRKVIDLLRERGYIFDKQEGVIVLSEEEAVVLEGVMKEFLGGQPTYKKAVSVYFGESDELEGKGKGEGERNAPRSLQPEA